MNNNYKVLKFIGIGCKILGIIALIGLILTTAAKIASDGVGMGLVNQNPIFILFNNLFPIYIGVFQFLFLYGIGELIYLLIDIKLDLDEIKKE
ncbi:hypothetical protein [Orenia marismortui]|uniref:Uncharacterized protein n=1 Tax=Orenia marismortui TaxID=46469 RepID=A0A4R8H8R2_9FIRM|nr:hypothetical protein [Orenia marismortui]TDX52296.1 hypothetical protein C7959_1072 [Orenia marismortui]